MRIKQVVLTGGPCAGKTTLLSMLKDHFKKQGINFITVPETATELIINGMVIPFKRKDGKYKFQDFVLRKQLNKEQLAMEYIREFGKPNDTWIIVYDRGIIDNKVYLDTADDFTRLLAGMGLDELQILDKYDLVIDLVSTAVCNPKVYNLGNEARSEDIELAKKVDARTTSAWAAHRNFRILNTSISLEEEFRIILNYIEDLLNDQQRKKSVILPIKDIPNYQELFNPNNSTKLDIQEYTFSTSGNIRHTVLIRELNNYTSYIHRIYKDNFLIADSPISSIDFKKLLERLKFINFKTWQEIYFSLHQQVYKICIYGDKSTLELEPNELNEQLLIPDFITLVDEKNLVQEERSFIPTLTLLKAY